MFPRRLLALCLFALPVSAWAQDGALCRNGLFPQEKQFALARIGGKERAWFFDDTDGCPSVGNDCRTSSYLVPGDTVVFSRIRNGFACAFFPNDKGGTAGWIEMKRMLLQLRETRQPVEAWVGEWTSAGNAVIRFERRLGALRVSGQAWWPGPPGTHDWPSTHEGAIAGRVDLAGHKGAYEDDDLCEARFTLLGDYLVASDNGKCGGANVSFSGVYTRR